MKNKIIYKWFYLFCTLLMLSISYVQAQINPLLLKDEAEIYPLVYFGMSQDEFKQKLSKRIIECKPNPNKAVADSGCKINLRFAGSGMSEGVGLFKAEKMVAFIARINTDFYPTVTKAAQALLGTSPQVESRVEKKGFFSGKIENEYSIWSFNNYQFIASKYDIQQYEEKGDNFSLIIESDNADFNALMKELSRKRSDIQIRTAQSNAPLGRSLTASAIVETQQAVISNTMPVSANSTSVSTTQNNIYANPRLGKLFASRPLNTSAKEEVTKVLDNLQVSYLKQTNPAIKSKLIEYIKKQEPLLASNEVEQRSDILIGKVSECITEYAMLSMEEEGIFNAGSKLPENVISIEKFQSDSDLCELQARNKYLINISDRREAKKRLTKMKSVNEVLLNGDKYKNAIYVSGFFIYDQNDPSLLLHSQDNINRIYVNTINLNDKYKQIVMECSLGCNLQILGFVDTYRRQYIINALQVYVP